MFSAAKLIAAAAVVALFGGLLLSGVFTAPDGSPAPASTTDDLLAGMVTEEVEPGVLRIHNDGYRDLHHGGRSWSIDGGIVVAEAGTPWLYDGMGRFSRIGDPAVYELSDQFLMDWEHGADDDHVYSIDAGADLLQGSPDGRLWLISANEIHAFDPELRAWDPLNGDIRAADMTVDDEGTVWATLTDELVRFDADGTPERYPLPEAYLEIEAWAVSPDGVASVIAMPATAGEEWTEETDILRLADGELGKVASAPTLGALSYPPAAGLGGALWMGGGYDWEAGDFPHLDLMRVDEDGWSLFTEADGIEPWGGKMGFVPYELIAASPDGSVWVDKTKTESPENNQCDGLGRFDGETWTSYLPGHCIADIDFTPDGDAWVLVEGPYLDGDVWGVFLVRP